MSFTTIDVFSGLLAGATLCPFDIKDRGLSPLASFLQKEKITYFVSTPSVFRYFARDLSERAEFPHLRMIRLGGEPFFRTDLDLYKKYFSPDCILVNQLSSSEMGPVCQYWMNKNTEVNTSIVPVGYPVPGKKIYVVDQERKDVGFNEVGEIAVSSPYLAMSYWNNAELTNDKFLTREETIDVRLYLSGDLGQMLPDGCLLYLGRKDDQVKIRGARVEIGEIEAVLSEYPQIKQSAVVAWDRDSPESTLSAYIVPRVAPGPSVSDIKDYLKTRLPDYMIPSTFMFLDALPLVNEKVNRKALPKPDNKRPELSVPYAAPRNKTEVILVRIWQEVLSVRPVGIHDNFFDVGGHSLAATRVISRVIQQFKIDIPLQSLFHSPTISDMAAVITDHHGKMLDESQLAAILNEIASLSDAEAQRLVSETHSTITKK